MWAKTLISGFGVGLRMRSSLSSMSVRSFVLYNNKTPKSNPKPSFSWHINNWNRMSFTTKASDNPGSIDSTLIQSMQLKIKEHLNAESVTVTDAYGDGRHVSIDVVSSAFEGKSAVNRQRMVYKAIWEELQSTVHAVDQMTTRTPAEAEPPK